MANRQQVAHLLRSRRLGVLDPSHGLFRTLYVAPGAVINASSFPSGNALNAITFSIGVRRTGDAGGIIFELGSSTTGIALWAEHGSIGCAVLGTARYADNVLPTGREVRVTLALLPEAGKARLWVEGRLVLAFAFTPGSGLLVGEDGKVGGVQTSVVSEVPTAYRITLANAVVGPLSVFASQVPSHFFLDASRPGSVFLFGQIKDDSWNGMPPGIDRFAASWTPGSNKVVNRLRFRVSRDGSPVGTLRAAIYTGNGTIPTTQVKLSPDIIDMAAVGATLQNLDFDMEGFALASGTEYWFALEAVASFSDGSNLIRGWLDTAGVLATSKFATYSGAIWNNEGDFYDGSFEVYGA